MSKTIIELRGITKVYPGIKALDDVSFDVMPGELHVLAGENGAGKSTLVNILQGAILPTSGEIFLEGQKVVLNSPDDAQKKGIGGVTQELMLVPWVDIARNMFLNHEPTIGPLGFFNLKAMHEQSRQLLLDLELDIDTRLPVRNLSPATKQKIAIAKALRTKPKILVLDEPTAILSERDVEILFKKIVELKAQGTSVIYISHRMQELRQIGDRVSVLRDGAKVGTVPIADITDAELIKMMVGRNLGHLYQRRRCQPGPSYLKLDDCSVAGGPQHVNLELRQGEIVGIAGLVGSGRTELARGILGIDRITDGKVFIDGQEVRPDNPAGMIGRGVALIPEERKSLGVALKLPIFFNILMSSFKPTFGWLYKQKTAEKIARKAVDSLRIATPSVKKLVGTLSGGNQQKVVIGKGLQTKAKILIFDEPTRGIDVGAKVEIHALMDELVNQGAAILMISSDLPEVIGMSDRVYVMYNGRIVGCFDHAEASQDKVAAVMLGIKGD